MYQLITAYTLTDRRNSRWQLASDLNDTPIRPLLSTYAEVWLVIDHPSFDTPRWLPLTRVINEVSNVLPTVTVGQWLTALGNKSLPFSDEKPTFERHYVKYANAWHAGYHIEPISRLGTLSQGGSKWDKEDLLIWRKGVDPETLARHVLFSVNGFFHAAEYGPDGVHIHDGNHTVRHANDNQVGLHSFTKVGALRYIPITDDMIVAQHAGASLYDGVYVTLPDNVDMDGCTFLCVIGGYLQALGKTYTRVGDRTYRIELSNLMLLERYYDSAEALSLKERLGLSDYPSNPGLLGVAEFKSDAVIRRYLTLSQSFFVCVDTPSLFHYLKPVEYSKLPGRYYDTDNTNYPLVGAYGRTLEYHCIRETTTKVLCSSRNIRHRYDFHRRQWRDMPATDSGRYPKHPFDDAQAYYRLLGTQT